MKQNDREFIAHLLHHFLIDLRNYQGNDIEGFKIIANVLHEAPIDLVQDFPDGVTRGLTLIELKVSGVHGGIEWLKKERERFEWLAPAREMQKEALAEAMPYQPVYKSDPV
jgi:hypothetical protein